jgi:hypothetical protein
MEAAPYHRFAIPSTRTLRQVGQDTGIPLEALRETLESMGFAWTSPDEAMREDELEVVPLIRLAAATEIVDQVWITRVGRAYAEGMRLAAQVENEAYRARFEEPVLAAGLGQRQAMERASEVAAQFVPLVDRALMAIYRRQQELIWTEHQVENIEAALEEAGAIPRPDRVPAMCFLDLAGYTRLTEERGDAAAAALAESLAVLVDRSARAHGGVPRHGPPGPRGRAAAGPCRGGRRAGGRPGRRLLRPHRQPGLSGRRPRPGRPGPGHRHGRPGLARRRRQLHRPG